MRDNKLVITTKPKTFYFDLTKDAGINLKHEIYYTIKHNELLAKKPQKTRLDNYCPHISMKTIFMHTENIKTSEPHKFILNLSQKLDLISSNKYVALQNLSIYYTCKNIRQQQKDKKLKIIAPTWNDEFELPDSFFFSVRHSRLYRVHHKKTKKHHPVILLFIFTSIGLI